MRPKNPRSTFVIILLICMILLSSKPISAEESNLESQIEISAEGRLSNQALELTNWDISNTGEELFMVGKSGDIWLIPTNNPKDAQNLENKYTANLYDVSWHPSGNSVLMVGDNGTLLRYSDGELKRPLETITLYGESMKAVDWVPSGQVAYLGGENGSLYSYRNNTFTDLGISWDDEISGIECHVDIDFCVVISRSDGIGVIDRDGIFHEIGLGGRVWIDVLCPEGVSDRCVVIGAGRAIAVFQYNRVNPESSEMMEYPSGSSISYVSEFSGEFRSLSTGANNQVYIQVVPFGIVEFSVQNMQSYSWLIPEDVSTASVDLSATTPLASWEERLRDGWLISTDGSISKMSGKQLSGDVMGYALVAAVAVSVPGVILGLIYMSSDTLQNKYLSWRKSRRQNKNDKIGKKTRK
ncbi:MAG: WD40 repeat domain-containing protein [Candidatus Thermoplasmatota archaeon]|nr:WD40 repeat domain-containing protein [Candidatus Thermoplasmatota archaeon]